MHAVRNDWQLYFTIRQFCRVHRMGHTTYYELKALGLTPHTTPCRGISADAVAEWYRMIDKSALRPMLGKYLQLGITRYWMREIRDIREIRRTRKGDA